MWAGAAWTTRLWSDAARRGDRASRRARRERGGERRARPGRGTHHRPPLAQDDVARVRWLVAIDLHAQPLRLRVLAVLHRASPLLVRSLDEQARGGRDSARGAGRARHPRACGEHGVQRAQHGALSTQQRVRFRVFSRARDRAFERHRVSLRAAAGRHAVPAGCEPAQAHARPRDAEAAAGVWRCCRDRALGCAALRTLAWHLRCGLDCYRRGRARAAAAEGEAELCTARASGAPGASALASLCDALPTAHARYLCRRRRWR